MMRTVMLITAMRYQSSVDCWQHEALAVTSGTKYILRTDVIYGW
jgi:hypothetical protein